MFLVVVELLSIIMSVYFIEFLFVFEGHLSTFAFINNEQKNLCYRGICPLLMGLKPTM